MSKIIRHVGRIKNTGSRCAVIFRTLPGDPNTGVKENRDYALVVETDSLPDHYHDNFKSVLESEDAQQTHELYNVLNRRTFVDGGNMLSTLHAKGYLTKVRVDDVVLFPMPNQPLPLRTANEAIDGIKSDSTTVDTPNSTPVVASNEEKLSIAHNLLAQAELLEMDANKKREEAYTLAPELRPTRGRPELTAEEKARKREEDNAKKRERYHKMKEAAKEQEQVEAAKKEKVALASKVESKLKRDEKRAK